MVELALDQLAAVIGGGQSTTDVQVGPFQYRSSTSDYRTCVDAVTRSTAEQYPDTRTFGVFGTDRNASARGRATNDNLRQVCGTPPS
jgi:hypothetical protein